MRFLPIFFNFFFIQKFLEKMLPEFFNLDVHFLFLLFDKFLSVKFFLVNFFCLINLFLEIFSTQQF